MYAFTVVQVLVPDEGRWFQAFTTILAPTAHTLTVNHDTQYFSWGQSMLMSPASCNAIKHALTG